MNIQLNFINRSNDADNSEIVVFQKGVSPAVGETAVAWQVISNLGQGWTHPLVFSNTTAIAAGDAWGNYSSRVDAAPGQLFRVAAQSSGDALAYAGPASNPAEIGLRNDLSKGAISAIVYRSGKPVARKNNVAPGQMAVFEFKPTIWIGVASQVEEGEVLDAAVISAIDTEISLLGIAAADIVMTGGGAGPDATPFRFQLENVQMA